jgi:hypothetical protein
VSPAAVIIGHHVSRSPAAVIIGSCAAITGSLDHRLIMCRDHRLPAMLCNQVPCRLLVLRAEDWQ